ncbi:vegetative cell wall protein gp1-like [Vitis vinifera]|uniref:vegetative cell wall protein gp1-like n=1 Tax=Vitis vinifera TaxID=29760 RepID=UPI002882FE8A|nr:vegetative cell wall protein gp1-like [Vitis vinifera]
MARTRGAKSSSHSNRKRSLRKEPSPGSAPEPTLSRPNPPPVKPAPPKPPAKRYLTRSGGRPLQKKTRVESLEPIDLTEQSPEPSPIPSPVQTPVPSPVPSPSPLPVPSPVPSPAPQEKSQEPQVPLPEPQMQTETALEEVIRRPMLPQPPIEGNLDCRTRAFHSELCFDLAAFRSLRKEPSPGSALEASPSRPIPPPVKPVPPKPPTRRYLTRSGGRPLQKKPRVESSEPIDLTEQYPEPSPIPSPVQTPVPSPVLSPSPLPVPSPNWLPRRAMSASRVAGVIHALEGWNVHECGNTMFNIEKIWEASLHHGFRPLTIPT